MECKKKELRNATDGSADITEQILEDKADGQGQGETKVLEMQLSVINSCVKYKFHFVFVHFRCGICNLS